MLEAGKLRHKITIEYSSYVQNSSTGAMTATWAVFKNVWAEVSPLSAREFTASQSEQSKIVARITVRYLPGINATMRILHRGKYYNIEGVLPDPESGLEYLTLPCSEGVRYYGEENVPIEENNFVLVGADNVLVGSDFVVI